MCHECKKIFQVFLFIKKFVWSFCISTFVKQINCFYTNFNLATLQFTSVSMSGLRNHLLCLGQKHMCHWDLQHLVVWHLLEMGNEEGYILYIQELELQHTLKELIEVHFSNLGIGYWLSSCLNCTHYVVLNQIVLNILKRIQESQNIENNTRRLSWRISNLTSSGVFTSSCSWLLRVDLIICFHTLGGDDCRRGLII